MLALIEEIESTYVPIKSRPGISQRRRWAKAHCSHCDKDVRVRLASIGSDSCAICRQSINATKHGKSDTPLHNTWKAMKSRCKNSREYANIKVCSLWINNFEAFESWALANGYSSSLSIDRINNSGDYEPANCRWTTQMVQNRNTRVLKATNTSGYRGVVAHQGKWKAQITVNYKNVYLGVFDTAEAGAKAYDAYIITNELDHNTNGGY